MRTVARQGANTNIACIRTVSSCVATPTSWDLSWHPWRGAAFQAKGHGPAGTHGIRGDLVSEELNALGWSSLSVLSTRSACAHAALPVLAVVCRPALSQQPQDNA